MFLLDGSTVSRRVLLSCFFGWIVSVQTHRSHTHLLFTSDTLTLLRIFFARSFRPPHQIYPIFYSTFQPQLLSCQNCRNKQHNKCWTSRTPCIDRKCLQTGCLRGHLLNCTISRQPQHCPPNLAPIECGSDQKKQWKWSKHCLSTHTNWHGRKQRFSGLCLWNRAWDW